LHWYGKIHAALHRDALDAIESTGHLVSDNSGAGNHAINQPRVNQFGNQRCDTFVDVGPASGYDHNTSAALLGRD
jgi:hypothetical protein